MKVVRLHGGNVHTPGDVLRVDVLIRDEKVTALLDPAEAADADEHIDVTGLDVLPGMVDLHAHARTPGLEYKEDFLTVSTAAAVGGITTYVDMPNVEPPTDSVERLLEKRELAARDSVVDWGHFASGSVPEAISGLAKAGTTGFKIFMVSGGYPHDERIAVSDSGRLYDVLEQIAATGLPCLVHPFDQALFDLFSRRAFDSGMPRDFRTRAEVYTGVDIVWRSAIATLIQFQTDLGVRLHVLHTHARGSLRLIREFKRAGGRITAALDPKYFHLTREDMERLGPRSYSGAVVTGDSERMDDIWTALRDGTIDTIDSDHGPHTLEEVERARTDAWSAQLGSPQYDDILPLLLNDVHKGQLGMADIVRLFSENPARIIGRFPVKGALLPGSDADIVVVDRERKLTLTNERVKTKVGWSAYEGWEVVGCPIMTFSRGRKVAEDGELVGEPGAGRYLPGRPMDWAEVGAVRSPGLWLDGV